jgi:phosphotransferase system HPr (HPr) family protein
VKLINPRGIHLRAATLVAGTARRFRTKVELVRDYQRADCSDVVQILTLGSMPGEQLLLEAAGPDAEAALDALVELFDSEFGENVEQNQKQEE